MIGLYAGLRREEALALQWDCVFLDAPTPYISCLLYTSGLAKPCKLQAQPWAGLLMLLSLSFGTVFCPQAQIM